MAVPAFSPTISERRSSLSACLRRHSGCSSCDRPPDCRTGSSSRRCTTGVLDQKFRESGFAMAPLRRPYRGSAEWSRTVRPPVSDGLAGPPTASCRRTNLKRGALDSARRQIETLSTSTATSNTWSRISWYRLHHRPCLARYQGRQCRHGRLSVSGIMTRASARREHHLTPAEPKSDLVEEMTGLAIARRRSSRSIAQPAFGH